MIKLSSYPQFGYSSIEFLSIREEVNNPNFNYGESAIIKSQVASTDLNFSNKKKELPKALTLFGFLLDLDTISL